MSYKKVPTREAMPTRGMRIRSHINPSASMASQDHRDRDPCLRWNQRIQEHNRHTDRSAYATGWVPDQLRYRTSSRHLIRVNISRWWVIVRWYMTPRAGQQGRASIVALAWASDHGSALRRAAADVRLSNGVRPARSNGVWQRRR